MNSIWKKKQIHRISIKRGSRVYLLRFLLLILLELIQPKLHSEKWVLSCIWSIHTVYNWTYRYNKKCRKIKNIKIKTNRIYFINKTDLNKLCKINFFTIPRYLTLPDWHHLCIYYLRNQTGKHFVAHASTTSRFYRTSICSKTKSTQNIIRSRWGDDGTAGASYVYCSPCITYSEKTFCNFVTLNWKFSKLQVSFAWYLYESIYFIHNGKKGCKIRSSVVKKNGELWVTYCKYMHKCTPILQMMQRRCKYLVDFRYS